MFENSTELGRQKKNTKQSPNRGITNKRHTNRNNFESNSSHVVKNRLADLNLNEISENAD